MTTQDLANVIATESGLTTVQADKALSALATNVANALRNNEEVYISQESEPSQPHEFQSRWKEAQLQAAPQH